MQPVEYTPEQTFGSLLRKGLVHGNPSKEMLQMRGRVGKPLGPPVVILASEAAKPLPKEKDGLLIETGLPKSRRGYRAWTIFRPVVPKPEIWEQMAKGRTSGLSDAREVEKAKTIDVREIKKAARGIGDLRMAFASSLEEWAQRPGRALSHYADRIAEAKTLPHYPKTEREKSDDKRIVFLAKVMAGLTLGLAPITAVKRLSHWTWPKDWAEKSTKEFVEHQRQLFSKKDGEPKP
jgi:hypothetical protein